MQASDLKPAGELAQRYGVKILCYGPPGSGKTPAIMTAPNPVLLATEPGLLSMRGSNIPTWEAGTADRIEDFRQWFFNSIEAKKFDTICVDSVSQMAELYLQRAEGKTSSSGNKLHGLAAYGKMADDTYAFISSLYYQREKHVYLVCKEETMSDGWRRPYFPGKELNAKIPHLYDVILRAAFTFIQGAGDQYAFLTTPSQNWFCRSRQNPNEAPKLAAFEPQNIKAIINKLMA